jgi:SpoIID/LytB domain protein
MALTRVRSIEARDRNEAGRPDTYSIVTDTGREYAMAPEELREAANWSVSGLEPITRENRFHSGDVEVIVRADSVRIIGRGFGHGVGMCQWCAKGMADSGMDWRSMIEQFYPGVDVRKMY